MSKSLLCTIPKRPVIIAVLFGSLTFLAMPTFARWHFRGGNIKDAPLIAQEVILSSEKLSVYKKEMDKYLLLAQKVCALVGVKTPGVLNILDKYSNSLEHFQGKTVSDIDNLPPDEMAIIKDAGKYDLTTYSGFSDYKKHLMELYQLNDIEALQLISSYMRNQDIKTYYLQHYIAMPIAKKIDGKGGDVPSDKEVGSKTAAIQQGNMISHVRGRSEIDGMQQELVQKANKLEREQIEAQLDSATQARGNLHPTNVVDPYNMNERESELWKQYNDPSVVHLEFTGKATPKEEQS